MKSNDEQSCFGSHKNGKQKRIVDKPKDDQYKQTNKKPKTKPLTKDKNTIALEEAVDTTAKSMDDIQNRNTEMSKKLAGEQIESLYDAIMKHLFKDDQEELFFGGDETGVWSQEYTEIGYDIPKGDKPIIDKMLDQIDIGDYTKELYKGVPALFKIKRQLEDLETDIGSFAVLKDQIINRINRLSPAFAHAAEDAIRRHVVEKENDKDDKEDAKKDTKKKQRKHPIKPSKSLVFKL